MLELRPTCEHCNKSLPPNSNEAMICSFECTFCKDCASNILQDICPNCGGDFTKRPIRPFEQLKKYPASKIIIHKPVNLKEHLKKINKK